MLRRWKLIRKSRTSALTRSSSNNFRVGPGHTGNGAGTGGVSESVSSNRAYPERGVDWRLFSRSASNARRPSSAASVVVPASAVPRTIAVVSTCVLPPEPEEVYALEDTAERFLATAGDRGAAEGIFERALSVPRSEFT